VFAQGDGGIGADVLTAQGDGGIGADVLTAQGDGGIGADVLTDHGDGGIGAEVFASDWVDKAFRPIALVRTSNTKTATTRPLFTEPLRVGNYAAESIGGLVLSRGKFHRCVPKRYTPLPSWLCQSLYELSRRN
jgi:hypothetical protein